MSFYFDERIPQILSLRQIGEQTVLFVNFCFICEFLNMRYNQFKLFEITEIQSAGMNLCM